MKFEYLTDRNASVISEMAGMFGWLGKQPDYDKFNRF